MAATEAAKRLTEAHRLGQARIAAATVRQMFAAWPLLDPEAIDATLAAWLGVTVPLIRAQSQASAALSASYFTAYRAAELGVDAVRFAPLLAEGASVEAVVTSLTVTGPVRIKQAMSAGRSLAQAVTKAQASAAAAAQRHALEGGRATVVGSVASDRDALGWARATSGQPCAFCALIASRGPVYKSGQTASFQPHDACHCTPEPVYHRDADWPAGSRRFADVYAEAKASDGDTLSNFRSLIEAA